MNQGLKGDKIIVGLSGLVFNGSTVTELHHNSPAWDFIPYSSTQYHIQQSHTPNFLAVSSDNRSLTLQEASRDDSQKWLLEAVPLTPGHYFIISVSNHKALDGTGQSINDDVIVYELHKGSNQQWKLIDQAVALQSDKSIAPQRRIYNSFCNFLSKHTCEEYNFGLFNNIIHNGDIFPKILYSLPMTDFIKLKEVCKHLNEILPDYWIYDKKSITITGLYADTDQLLFKGPVVRHHILRISIHLRWSDQGWGNCKTSLMFYLKRDEDIIAQYIVRAEHKVTEHYFIFDEFGLASKSQRGDRIEVWRHVGGGGGHVMHITFLKCLFELLK